MKQKSKSELKKEFNLDEVKTVEKALEILPKVSKGKFVGSVDLDIILRLKENQKKESVKGSIMLPVQFGAEKRIVVLCDEADKDKALKAGAIKAGLDDVKKELMDGFSDFDVLIATVSVMPKIVELGKVLGPKGLMPNPRNETITTDVEKAVKSFKAGKVNFKMEQGQGAIRIKVGKMDMPKEALEQNIAAVIKAVFNEAKRFNALPFKKVTLTSTMGAGIRLDVNDIMQTIK